MIRILVLLLILMLISSGSALEVSSINPSPGEKIVLTGTTKPDESVRLRSSFQMELPVENGRYEYVAKNIEIPQTPNSFGATAKNVKNLGVGVKLVFWLTRTAEASRGSASISQANIPPGKYTVKIFGEAADSTSAIPVEVKAETEVCSDSHGNYMLTIDTTGIPEGEYKISAAGEEKVIWIGGAHGTQVPEKVSTTAPAVPIAPDDDSVDAKKTDETIIQAESKSETSDESSAIAAEDDHTISGISEMSENYIDTADAGTDTPLEEDGAAFTDDVFSEDHIIVTDSKPYAPAKDDIAIYTIDRTGEASDTVMDTDVIGQQNQERVMPDTTTSDASDINEDGGFIRMILNMFARMLGFGN